MYIRSIITGRLGIFVLGYVLALVVAIAFVIRWNHSNKPQTKPQTVSIAIGTWAGFGNAIVGRDVGLFPNLDVRITVQDDPTVLSAGLGKSFMVVQSSMDYAAQMLANGVKGKILLITDESSGGDAIVTDPSIKNVADLVGRLIVYTVGPASEWLLAGVLAKEGKTLKDVKIKTVNDPIVARDIYIKGDADAIVIWQPFIEQAMEKRRSKIIVSSRDMPERVFGVLIASPEMLANKDLTERFLQGWFAADEYRTKHPDESATMISKLLQVSPEDTKLMLNGTKIASIDRNREFFVPSAPAKPAKLEILMREALDYWQAKGDVPKIARLISPLAPEAEEFFQHK